MPELLIVEDRTYERADARWLRLRCTDPDCVMIEARIEPADAADHFVDTVRSAHAQLHAETGADQ